MGRHANPSPQLRRSPSGAWRCWANGDWHHIAAADAPMDEVRRRHRLLLQRLESNPSYGRKLARELSLAELVEQFLLSPEAPKSSTARFLYVQTLDLLTAAFMRPLSVREYDGDRQREFRGWLVAQRIGERQRWNTTSCNKFLAAVRRLLKFAESHDWTTEKLVSQVGAVQGVRRGDTRAPRLVGPADTTALDAALPKLRGPLAAMLTLQRATGMRSGEVCRLRPCDVHRSGVVNIPVDGPFDCDSERCWLVVMLEHKTDASGRPAWWVLNAEAQAALAPYLARDPLTFCFSPQETIADLRTAQRAERKGQGSRKPVTGRVYGDRYTVGGYRQALRRACIAAGVAPATPHSVRHRHATDLAITHGLDAARSALNHAGPMTTLRYAQRDLRQAARIARGE